MNNLETINISTLRTMLETYGMNTRNVRKIVTDNIFNTNLKQQSRFSTILTPNNATIEETVYAVLVKYKLDITSIDITPFAGNDTAEQLHNNLLEKFAS